MVRLPQGDGVALGVVDDSEEAHSPTTRIVLGFLTSVVIEFGVAISVSVRKICEIKKKKQISADALNLINHIKLQ